MKTLEQPKCGPLPSLTTTSIATESVCAPRDTNIGWVCVTLPLFLFHTYKTLIKSARTVYLGEKKQSSHALQSKSAYKLKFQ